MNEKKEAYSIFLRYLVLILIAVPNLWLFYTIFTPLTTYPVKIILDLFYNVSLINGYILTLNNQIAIELVEACIAGSAYYLLAILNLSTANIKTGKRILILFLAFFAFLILNIIRISILSAMVVSQSRFFDVTHFVFWYGISTLFVIAIWFAEVKMFKVKSIPLYTDFKFLYRLTKRK